MKESARQQQALLEEMMRLTLGMNGEQTTDIQMQTRTTPVTHQDDMLDDDSVEKAEARIEHDLMAISFLQLGEGKVRTHDEAGQIQRYLQQLLSMSKNDTQICDSEVTVLHAAEKSAQIAVDQAQMKRAECKRAELDAAEAVQAADGAAKAVQAESLAEESQRVRESILLSQARSVP